MNWQRLRKWLFFSGVFFLFGCQGKACSKSSKPEKSEPPENAESALEEARDFYKTRPYYQQPFEQTEVPEGLPNLEAETCGNCHEQIYREWKVSTHHRAWTDPQFQAELKKSRSAHKPKKDDDVGWMCVNCHTPLKNQLPRFVVGLENGNIGKPKYRKNPNYSKELRHEGITCASCHVRDGKVYGPWGDTNAPHPTAKDPDLKNENVCVQCHQAEAHWPSRNLACFFNTGKQWKNSKYGENKEYCQSCHMPKVKRRLVKGDHTPKRMTRRHWFGGSLIPKRPSHKEQLKPLRKIFGSGAKIKVGEPTATKPDTSGSNPGLLEASPCSKPSCIYLPVEITNAYAGHKLPTGDPERHIDIRATVKDKTGKAIQVAEQRIASKYKWWPNIKLQYDNRLAPGEKLRFYVAFDKDERPVTVELTAKKYRMYKSAFEHHELEGKYVRGRTFHRSEWRVPKSAPPKLKSINDDFGERDELIPESKKETMPNR